MKKTIIELLVISLVLASFIIPSTNAVLSSNPSKNLIFTRSISEKTSITSYSYTDLTVDEAWNLLNDTSNGIQIPIDVRTDSEWTNEHIDTPIPEHPRHHNFYDWEDSIVLQDFLSAYANEEIIVYCRSGSRSVRAINILIDNGFSGTIYNIIGGITEWKAEGYPTIGNRPPETPTIYGPSVGQLNQEYEFTVHTIDPDVDNVFYCVDWNDSTPEECFGPFPSDEEVIISHSWTEKGLFHIQVKARDEYNDESQWNVFDFDISFTELEISSIQGGFASVSMDIKNIGDNTAENISSVTQVRGGILSRINLTHICSGCSSCGTTLGPGKIKTESTSEAGLLFGIGPIEITASTWADNADKVTVIRQGYALGLFIIVS